MGRRLSLAMLLLLFFITTLGCGTTENTRYYLLRPMIEPAPVGELSGNVPVIGLGPIRLPDYLDRPQIVTTSGTGKLELAEFDRWAEPLSQSFSRTLAENLSALLSENRVVLFPWDRSTTVSCQVKIDVVNFSAESSRRAVLDARWTIIKGGKVIVEKHSVFAQPIKSAAVEDLVLAESRAVADLSKAIAEAVRTE